jgi:hypothetical protein
MNTRERSFSALRSIVDLATIRSVWLAFAAATVAACGGGGGGGGGSGGCGGAYDPPCPPTSAGNPSVTLSVPNTTPNRTITLTATPTAPNGVTRVEFLVGTTVIGQATAAPYTVNWDTSTVADGAQNVTARVTDAMNLTATSAVTVVTVTNNITVTLALTPAEEYPLPVSSASGTGQINLNIATGAISSQFTLTGMTATMAHIHDGYAGNNGGVLHGYQAHATIANRWDLPAGTVMTQPNVNKLLAGGLYVNVHSAAYPLGEIRSQVKPAGVQVFFADMNGAQEVPAVTTTASGVAALTLDNVARKVSVHLNTTGVNDATMAHIHRGAAGVSGGVVFGLTQHSVNMGHWSIELRDISTTELADLNANLWYANVHTPAHGDGEIRGQIVPNPGPPATTLTQLQSTIFGPICSGCHNGIGTTLPGVMDLTGAAVSHASLVNVASLQQGGLMRVQPNNPADSYLIRKLEGAAGITGGRMPLGGPFLSQPTIDTVKSWINSGAPNN